MKNITIITVFLLTLVSCDLKDDCGACFTPPRQFNFEFSDKDSGEDLFDNGTFNIDDVKITDEEDKNVTFEVVLYNDSFIVSINSIGWELEPKTYTIQLNDDTPIVFDLDMNTASDNCCSYFEVENFELYDYEYSESNTTGIIQVKI
ncbi:hypothetical protein [Lutibacter citreus]|uniref:hypothetical protein n=1 Tax=Lutibacter citreus TaxID=2138210 RepID=UPI000DBE013B|nr:hypothetical protein [Lutibacter citreus]